MFLKYLPVIIFIIDIEFFTHTTIFIKFIINHDFL